MQSSSMFIGNCKIALHVSVAFCVHIFLGPLRPLSLRQANTSKMSVTLYQLTLCDILEELSLQHFSYEF